MRTFALYGGMFGQYYYHDEDGVVAMNSDQCIGCRAYGQHNVIARLQTWPAAKRYNPRTWRRRCNTARKIVLG